MKKLNNEEMNEKMNLIHNMDCLDFMKQVPDDYFQLIIVDPPYFEIKGEFDFIWKSFDDYLEWMEELAIEFNRILSDNGSLYLYGHAKRIAYKQVIFDKYFNLENHIVWEKTDCQTRIGIDNFRSYAPIKEHILFYSKEILETGRQSINNNNELYKPIRDYFNEQRELISDISYNEINKICFGTASNGGGMASNILTSYKRGWAFPTCDMYEKLRTLGICKKPYEELRKEYEELRKEYEELRKEYEELRKEYEELRRPFENIYRLEDIMKFAQEVNTTGKYNHPTQKPPKLSKALIRTSTRQDSKVFIPFIGSGTEAEACKSLGLEWCGCELEKDYCDIANKRLENVQLSLF